MRANEKRKLRAKLKDTDDSGSEPGFWSNTATSGVEDEKKIPNKQNTKDNTNADDEIMGIGDSNQKVVQPKVEPKKRKWGDLLVRASWSVVMVFGFFGLILAGHIFVFGVVILVQSALYSEISALRKDVEKEKKMPFVNFNRWYFFVVFMVLAHGRSLRPQVQEFLLSNGFPPGFYTTHEFICFVLYSLGIVNFVLTLRKGHFGYCFEMFVWTHMTLLLVILQTSWLGANIFSGMIWFVIPAFSVVVNDITAYLFGRAFGRTPLIAISPKKTWEGFIGATVATILIGFLMATIFSEYQHMVCPKKTFDFRSTTCEPSTVFQYVDYQVPFYITRFTGWSTVTLKPVQLHGIALASFASIIGPFGGFFASGIKRALKKKDFGDIIPGHGGLTDRFDCQILMGAFAFFYCRTFVFSSIDVDTIVNSVMKMKLEDQLQVYEGIVENLKALGHIA